MKARDNINRSQNAGFTEDSHPDNKQSSFLLVDYGDKLGMELETSRLELQRQAVSLLQKIELLWEVVRAFIILVVPVIAGLGASLISRIYLPSFLATTIFTIFFSITVGFIFINITPLTEAIESYLRYKVYTPHFVSCPCDTCQSQDTPTEDGATVGSTERPEETVSDTKADVPEETLPCANEID